MVKLVIFLAALTGFAFVMWENLEEKASVFFLGKTLFENVPVLLIILISMLAGMLLLFPLIWLNKINALGRQRAKTRASKPETSAEKKSSEGVKPSKDAPKEKVLAEADKKALLL